MSGIFISYRRDDSAGHAGRLYDHLSRVFGADTVFMDVDDIQRGDDYADTLNQQLRQADVLLAVIGRHWTTLTDAAGQRRLDNADDWVRGEIHAALANGLLVIPVLVGGAALPGAADLPEDIRALAERQQAEVRDGSWNDDVGRLCRDIKRRRARGSLSERLRSHWRSAAVVLALALAAGGYSVYTWAGSQRVNVPNVSGLTLERATRDLAGVGLAVGDVTQQATNEQAPGWVLEQKPASQTSIRRGSAVSLIVAAPRAVDLAPWAEVRDVGQEGTVAAAACATAMDASLSAQGRPLRLSMRYIYEKAKRHDEVTGEGTFLETTIYVARQFGAPPESIWPYRALNRSLPAGVTWRDLDNAAADYKATMTQIPGLDAILATLDRKTPVLAVATATEAWSTDDATRTGLVKPAGANQATLGSTVITIVGYDPATSRFKFANNWGVTWGDGGFGYFTAADAQDILQLDQGLWAVTVPPPQR